MGPLLNLTNYRGKRRSPAWRTSDIAFIATATAPKTYHNHKLDSQGIIFFTPYRNIASTNTPVDDDRCFLGGAAPR